MSNRDTSFCTSRFLTVLGFIVALGVPASAAAHTVQICWEDSNGVTTFYAGTYHSENEAPSPTGGIIIDGFTYPFTGYIYPSQLPATAGCWSQPTYQSWRTPVGNPDGVPHPGVRHFQTFTAAFPYALHTISFTQTNAIVWPWRGGFDPQWFGGGGACADADFDGICNDQDACPLDAANDGDGDGICGNVDNCPLDYNPSQTDANNNGQGDACEGVVCGNGLLQGSEECDDGNIQGGDGCSNICTIEQVSVDADGDGADDTVDCDDNDANNFPGNTEVCDGQDNNCDTAIDEGFDADGDGFTTCAGDCDDSDANTNPVAVEDCDGVDNDCDGIVPVDELDQDGDGVSGCAGDCYDLDANTYPGAVELCDGNDNDCDGIVPGDEIDDDGDAQTECNGDCDDADAANFTGNAEVCDGQDNDCNGADDVLGFAGSETDNDGDGQSECNGDCDDADAANFSGNAEVCDGQDNDCNGADDVLGFAGSETDNDGDAQSECNGDCDDSDSANFSGNTEACDGQDNDCDVAVDEGYPDFDADSIADCVDPDDDNDGVDDGADECAWTLTDDWAAGVPSTGTLGSNRWMYDAANDVNGDGSFTQQQSGNGKNNGNGNGNNQAAGWTYSDTAGCSCAQIIDQMALGNGHTKHGCSNSAMSDWNAIVFP